MPEPLDYKTPAKSERLPIEDVILYAILVAVCFMGLLGLVVLIGPVIVQKWFN